jgi:glycosyltransferase involved in cell wall biosynthesis
MSEQSEGKGTASASEVRRIIALFDTNRDAALAQVGQLVEEWQPAGLILQHLNRFGRPDIVTAFADALTHDTGTPDLIVFEHVRALAGNGAPNRGEELLATASVARSRDYAFQYSAGRLLREMQLHTLALQYFDAAFRIKPTAQAAEQIFLSHLSLEQYHDASLAMGRLLRSGTHRPGLSREFAYLLDRIAPGELDPELAFALAALPGADSSIGTALMPHLVAADLLDSVLAALARDAEESTGLPEDVLLAVFPYLARRGQIEPLLRMHEKYGAASSAVRARFAEVLRDLPANHMTQFLAPRLREEGRTSGDARAYSDAAARFSTTADPDMALAMLRLLPRTIGPDAAEAFYLREKARLARLAGFVVERLGPHDDVLEVIAAFIAFWIAPTTRSFFAGPEFRDLIDTIAAARRLNDAEDGSRAAHLREEYFAHHHERRGGGAPDEIENDFEFCEAALSYFQAIARQRPVATIPVGKGLAARLGRPALSLGREKPVDALASFALLQGRPPITLSHPKAYDDFCWWYLTGLAGTGKVPPACLQPDVVAYLDETVAGGDLPGLRTTRFLKLVWSNSEAYRRQFDFSNAIDRVLLVIDMAASVLPANTQFLPFFHFLVDDGGNGVDVLHRVIALLTDKSPTPRETLQIRSADAPQDVLLVGHASKDSGLGRNFAMLSNALTMDNVKLTGIDYDWTAAMVHEELRRWYANCRSHPIVVFAVNAQDVPDFFVKDRSGTLFDCYTAGFFLWEVSRAADVQKLGATLVDEIWTPTRYVADVYAPLNGTHVVGKGLFRGDEAFLSHSKVPGANPAFRFVTVFDFDSSIERKNPLAVALAFQKAFPSDENVELVIKTSNVNPQHWSNGELHWERLLKATANDRRVRLVTARLSNADMEALVRDADCVVSLHRSEGFGYLISDAMAYGTPVIATDYSGSADFCNSGNSWPVSYRLIDASRDATRWHCDDAQWADADVDAAAAQMRRVFENFDDALQKAARARSNVVEKYSLDSFRAAVSARIVSIRSNLRQKP